MKTIKIITALSIVCMLVSCNNGEEAKSLDQLTTGNAVQETPTVATTGVLDSLKQIDSQIGLLRNAQESKKSQMEFLTRKRDSLKNSITQVETSISQVKARKIEPGINGVNTKLDKLKGQRENILEQQNLQKREVALAEKRISLLSEEKAVYDEQRKGLWDKGAAPQDFKVVDSLLAGINGSITEQETRLKGLTRSINDIQEQTASIEKQRTSLSSKIRNNYTAQEIFDDFSKEEKVRLTAQLEIVESQLTALGEEDLDLSNALAMNTSKKDAFASEQQQIENQTEIVKQQQLELASKNEADSSLAIKSESKKSRVTYALVGLGVLAIILLLFYIIGKKRKAKKSIQY